MQWSMRLMFISAPTCYHSFRHGTASDIWLQTKDLQQVQSAGRWLTKAAARWYIHIIQIPPDVGDDD